MKRVSYITARAACLAAIVLLPASAIHAGFPTDDINIVDFGSDWFYLNPQNLNQDPFNNLEGVDFDLQWFLPTYNQADLTVDDGGPVTLSWQGPAPSPIGYEVINGFPNGLATDIGQPADGERYTTYLRGLPFNRPAGAASGPYVIEFLADDGIAMYLNGAEVDLDVNDPDQKRYNCCIDIGGTPVPQNFPPVYLDRASGTGPEDNFITRQLGDFSLNASNNMIAVSLHQAGTSSSDIGFEMRIFVPGTARPWGGDFSGDWDDATNWSFGVPAANQFAVFDAYNAVHTIWTNSAQTVDGVQFEDNNTHNIAGTGSINLGDGGLNALSGDPNDPVTPLPTAGQHEFQVRVNLNSNVDALIEEGSSITFNNRLNLNGRTLNKGGDGDLLVRNTDNSGDGTINVSEGVLGGGGKVSGSVNLSGGSLAPSGSVVQSAFSNKLEITGDANVTAGGATLAVFGNGDSDAISGGGAGTLSFGAAATINIVAAAGYTPANGDTAQVFLDWASINNSGATINAPGWDTSNLFVDGTITFGAVVEADCDFNGDTLCNTADIDMLTAEIATGGANLALDIDGDGSITTGDLDTWLAEAGTKNGLSGPYLPGDANLDGAVNAQDLNELGQRWQAMDNLWSHGDFTADGNVNASDLNELGQRWQQVVPAAAAATAVPEPSALSLLLLASLGLLGRRRRR